MTAPALAAAHTYAVVVIKASGARVVFAVEATREAAELMASRLAAVGIAATCERARATDVAGSTRRP
ncbi:MAG: hypothetical protein ABI624_10055 [Casimicrobiaceae bacterium]